MKLTCFSLLLLALCCACGQQKNEYPNISDATRSALTLSSNDTTLVHMFNWAVNRSNKYVGSDTDPVGPWYEAALPARQAFCMRDVSHQCIGEEINGHSKQNANMFARFAENISASKDYCTYWEIDKDNLPAPADYVSDKDFWYNLNANFDVLDACYRMYLWTGNKQYISDPRFEQFFSQTVNEYVEKWQLQADKIMDRPGVMHEDEARVNPKFKTFRGLPSYEESVRGLTVTGDLIATIYRGLKSYAQICNINGDEEASRLYDAKAEEYARLYDSVWWNEQTQNYYAYKVNGTLNEGGNNVFPIWFGIINKPERVNRLLAVIVEKETNVECMSYYPTIFYKYGKNDAGYRYLNELYTNERRDYPEVASGVIEGIVSGLAGVRVDASANRITTVPRLSAQTRWVSVENIPLFSGKVSILHLSGQKSSLVNKSDKEIIWRAMFAGDAKTIHTEKTATQAEQTTDGAGNVYSFIDITCQPGETVMAEMLPNNTRLRIDLGGKWGLCLDTTGVGFANTGMAVATDSLLLPGTTDIGKKGTYNTAVTQTMALSREYIFEGKALYTKTVEIPTAWDGTAVRLYMERTKPTVVWIDGKEVGRNSDITTPQQYDLSRHLLPGTHTIAIQVDNGKESVPTKVLNSSHAYSPSTQTNWNGVIGDFYLESAPLSGIEEIQIYPDVAKRCATVKVSLRRSEGASAAGKLSFYAEAWNTDKRHQTAVGTIEIDPGSKEQTFELELGNEALLWSEFDPALYKLTVSFKTDKATDTQQADFGLRSFKVKGTQFTINDQITFLRGKHDACVFPLIAHTAMDMETWQHYFQVSKQYGINHYRFHSWCPPKACFEAADIEGIYLQPELPIWGSIDSNDQALCDFLLKEGHNLHKAYSNHASFVMFALGNEMWGEEGLTRLVRAFKQADNRHLYAAGSNNFLGMKGKMTDEEYFTTCRVGADEGNRFTTHARASFSFADAYDGGYLNHTYPNSVMNFDSAVALCDVPVIGHETGQYQVYPNYDEMKKYTGVLKPRNFEVFKKRLEEAGMSDQAHDFLMASGKWSALLYRADIEMNLRTPHLAGFQLLDLQDYPGQGSAYVGILDAFMDSKGLITPEEWRNFCSEVVPLFCTEKFCWTTDEVPTGEIRIANYSADALDGKQLSWTLTDNRQQVVDKGTLPLQAAQGELATVGTVKLAISSIKKAEQVMLALSVDGTSYKNSYSLWIYPAAVKPEPAADIRIATDLPTALNELQNGGKVLLFPSKERHADQTVGGLFQTDYWNYRMFKTICENGKKPVSPGTMGILTDPTHPALADFPTEFHTNWQWFPIVKESYPMILDRLPEDYRPIVQVIDNIERNHKLGLLFEFKVGNGKLLVCMSDLKAVGDKPEACQFYNSILQYMNSADFNPSCPLTVAELKELFSSKVQAGKIERLGNISYE